MSKTLGTIGDKGGSERLTKFLRKYYPQMIKDDISAADRVGDADSINRHQIFTSYSPGILTYPRRIILVGPLHELRKEVGEFVLDKPVHDSILVDDRAYIEYLEKSDMHLKDSIPMKNWQIAAYRNKHKL
jgi:hypothetical protein